MPYVTAIITTFNRANYLKKAIVSVLAQTMNDFELLILDNGSIDDTEEVVRNFKDVRIRYIKHEPLNISQARNLGVKEAKSEYIAFLDDDDEWLPNKLMDETRTFKHAEKNVGLVYGGFFRIDTEGNKFYTHKPKLKGSILKEILSLKDDFTGSASNPMLKKSVLLQLGGYDEKVHTGEDWELYLRLTEKFYVNFVSDPVVKIRHHFGTRLGARLKDYIDLEKMVLERFDYIFKKNKKLQSFYLQRIGGKFIRLGEKVTGRVYLMKAARSNPFNFYVYIQYILSFTNLGIYGYFHKIYLNCHNTVKS